MKNLILAAVLLLSGSMLTAQNTSQQSTIELTGSAETQISPDRFDIAINYGETKEFLGKDNIANVEKQLLAALAKIGVKKDSVKVTQLANTTATTKKPLLSKQIKFTLDDFAKLDDLSRMLDFKGIYNINIVSAKSSQEEVYMKNLRALSLKDARSKAEDILLGSGYAVGKIVSITENGYYRPRFIAQDMVLAEAVNAKGVVEQQRINTYQDVTLRYEIRVIFTIEEIE